MAKYKMNKKMYDNILKTRKTDKEKKMNKNEYVCLVVNNEFNLKNYITEVIVVNN